MSFDYELVADPSKAVAASHQVEDSLVSVEKRAAAAGFSMGDAFSKGAAAARGANTAFQASKYSIDDVAAAYTRINAPLDALEKDLAVLDRLQKDGALSARQYADELERIGKAAGLANSVNPMNAVSLPEAKQQGGGGAVGALSVAGGNMLSNAVGMAKDAVVGDLNFYAELREKTEQASNALLKFYDTKEQADAAVGSIKTLASELHAPLDQTVEAYGAVREASEGLYLTQKELIDVTRSLSASMIVDGKSMADVEVVMGKFQFAMEKGSMGIGELKSIAKNYPDVMHDMEAATNKTYEQLVTMAKGGTLTKDVLEQMIRGIGSSDVSMEKFGQRTLTISEVLSKNLAPNTYEAVRYIAQHRGEWERLGPTVVDTVDTIVQNNNRLYDSILDTSKAVLGAVSAFDQMGDSLGALGDGLQLALSNSDAFMSSMRQFKIGMDLTTPVVQAKAKLADLDAQWANQIDKSGGVTKAYRDMRKALVETITGQTFVDYYAEELKKIRGPHIEFENRQAAINALMANGKINITEYRDELEKLKKQFNEYDPEAARGAYFANKYKGNQVDVKDAGTLFDMEHPASEGWQEINPFQKDEAKANQEMLADIEKANAATKELQKSMDDFTKDQKEKIGSLSQVIETQLVSSIDDLSSNIVDAANGADVSWSKMLEGMEKAILKATLLRALTGSWTGQKGAGGGGDWGGFLGAVVGGAFATGGTYTAPLTGGGEDSIPVLFRMNPGETATFTNPGQEPQNSNARASQSSGASSSMYMTFAPQMYNERALLQAVQTPDGKRIIYSQVQQAMGGYIRSLA